MAAAEERDAADGAVAGEAVEGVRALEDEREVLAGAGGRTLERSGEVGGEGFDGADVAATERGSNAGAAGERRLCEAVDGDDSATVGATDDQRAGLRGLAREAAEDAASLL